MRGAVAGALLAALLAVVSPAPAEAATPAGLSVSIHAGSGEVHPGDRLTYTATVRNEGTTPIAGRLVITVPDFVRVSDAGDAERAGSDTTWAVTAPAGGSVTKKLTGVLDKIPKGQLRVTTLVSLYLGDDAQPTIRSADAATIAGVKDPAHAVGDSPAKPSAVPSPSPWIAVGAAALAIGAIAVWQLLRRRRRQR